MYIFFTSHQESPFQIGSVDIMVPIYEIIMFGNSDVGKSSLLSCYVNGEVPKQSQPTEGVEFLVKTIVEPSVQVKLKIWDTAGHKREILRKYYTNFNGALLVYNIHDRESYDAAQEWTLKLKARKATPRIVIALVGNLADVLENRVVTTEEAKRFAERNGLIFWETSATTNLNINKCFLEVAIAIRKARISSCCLETLMKKRSHLFL